MEALGEWRVEHTLFRISLSRIFLFWASKIVLLGSSETQTISTANAQKNEILWFSSSRVCPPEGVPKRRVVRTYFFRIL